LSSLSTFPYSQSPQEGASNLELKVTIVAIIEGIFLAAVLIDKLAGGHLAAHGIHPRNFPGGLFGIFFAPFLHKGLSHLFVNCFPFAVLSLLVMLRRNGISTYFVLSGITMLAAGTMVWTLGGSGSNHIGSSGMIFSYFGYLVVSGVVRRNLRDFLVGATVFLFYSGIFWGILPIDERVSWEAHLFGLLSGCCFGFIDSKLADQMPVAAKEEQGTDEERARLADDDELSDA
jgi:membrane associated rhomboid family serine protease